MSQKSMVEWYEETFRKKSPVTSQPVTSGPVTTRPVTTEPVTSEPVTRSAVGVADELAEAAMVSEVECEEACCPEPEECANAEADCCAEAQAAVGDAEACCPDEAAPPAANEGGCGCAGSCAD